MRKWTYLVAALLMSGTAATFTSCIDTTEPAGIEEMRSAKADLLRQKAELQKALAEKQGIENQIAALNVELQQAINAWKMDSLKAKQDTLALSLETKLLEMQQLKAQADYNLQKALEQINVNLITMKDDIYLQKLSYYKALLVGGPYITEDGEEETTIETVTETVLTITITHKTAAEMAEGYRFNSRQKEYLNLMMQPDNQNLWAQLLGGLAAGGGQVIAPDTGWVPIGALAWPLPQTFAVTSHFGYREDPFTGEIDYHNGTDIAAPAGTPILAAAAGTVAIANGIDSWGGGYGYHIKIDHGDGLETLYAHCSAICVTPGQQVQQGEVIGFVGSTGNSTGNHLHMEAWINGERVDFMRFFKSF